MLDVKDKGILLNIIVHCIRVEKTLINIDKSKFDNDKNIKDIICFNIFQIGELAKHLSPGFLSTFDGVPWKSIKGTRDIIGHGYGAIEYNRVWNTAINDIKPLHKYCDEILNNL